ncbi:MAG: hypothetical protein ABIW46_04895 [Acidimicrobiales bacterium]
MTLRTVLELGMVVALGGMVASVLRRVATGRLAAERCPSCGEPASRAYPRCRRCRSMVDGPHP